MHICLCDTVASFPGSCAGEGNEASDTAALTLYKTKFLRYSKILGKLQITCMLQMGYDKIL